MDLRPRLATWVAPVFTCERHKRLCCYSEACIGAWNLCRQVNLSTSPTPGVSVDQIGLAHSL